MQTQNRPTPPSPFYKRTQDSDGVPDMRAGEWEDASRSKTRTEQEQDTDTRATAGREQEQDRDTRAAAG